MRHLYAILLAIVPWSVGVADDRVAEFHRFKAAALAAPPNCGG
jgi:hypothetical protein